MLNKFKLSRKGAELYAALQLDPANFTAAQAQKLRNELSKLLKTIQNNLFDPVFGPEAKAALALAEGVIESLQNHHFEYVVSKCAK